MQIKENRCDVAGPRFLCDYSSKSVLDTLKVSQIRSGCASQWRELQKSSREPTIAAAMVLEASLVREARM